MGLIKYVLNCKEKCMSSTDIPKRVLALLWGKSAGRCEFTGCNIPLCRDALTNEEFNNGQNAHIIADSPNGPRGDVEKSEQLKKDLYMDKDKFESRWTAD